MRHELLTKAELAERFGKDERTITNWQAAGMPSRQRAGKVVFAWLQCLQWREKQIERAAKEGGGSAKESELEQKIRVERRIKELELAAKTRELVPVEEFDEVVRSEEGAFYAFITGQMQGYEPDIVRAITPADARKLTQRMTREILAARRAHADDLDAAAEALEQEEEKPDDDKPEAA